MKKKTLKAVLTATFLISAVGLFGVADTPGIQIVWSLANITVLVLSAKGLERLGAYDE